MSDQERSDQGGSAQVKSGWVRSCHVKAMSRSDQVSLCQGKVRLGQDRSGHVRSSIRQVRSGNFRSVQVQFKIR